jgi:ATP-dependent helicase HrpA
MGHNFLVSAPFEWLQHFPRFLQAIQFRLRRLSNAGLARDEQAQAEVSRHWHRYQERLQRHQHDGVHDPQLEHYRWMIEELRVGLFAQGLHTSLPVSTRRLDKQFERVRA